MMRATAMVAALLAAAVVEDRLAQRWAGRHASAARRMRQDAVVAAAGAAAFAAVAGARRLPWGLLLPVAPTALVLALADAPDSALLLPKLDASALGVGLAAGLIVWTARGGGRWRCVLLCGAAGFGLAAANGWALRGLPWAYHDEFAYEFQAKGFLDGHAAYPADELTPAFRQMHVLTHGAYGCRYFPGTALWLMPFVAAGVPWLAGWIAAGGTAAATAALAWHWGRWAGYAAGMLVAAAPGVAAFGNTLLSPGPAMLAFAVFAVAYLSMFPRPTGRMAFVAGLAMGFAFISRPLTAVGLGLPFAVHAVVRFGAVGRRRILAALAGGFAAVAALLPLHNWLALGTAFETPYSRYTAAVTPCHVYGFFNRDRGLPQRGPDTEVAYDDWAENLLPAAAPGIVAERWLRLLAEGLAAPAFLALGLAAAMFAGRNPGRAARPGLGLAADRGPRGPPCLLLASALGLTAVYAPYWFTGVFGYGYLAEAIPAVACIAAFGGSRLAAWLEAAGVRGASAGLAAALALRLAANAAAVAPEVLGPQGEIAFARHEHARFAAKESETLRAEHAPLLVLVQADPKTAVHSTLVHNDPRRDGPVVRAWHDDSLVPRLLARYPDRAVYILEHRGFAQPFGWRRLRGPAGGPP